MLCFDVYVNARRQCRAGVGSGGTTAILHCSAGLRRSAGARARSKRDQVDLNVGGLFQPAPRGESLPEMGGATLEAG